MRDVLLNCGLGVNFGWGLLGLNIFAQWAHDPEIRPLMGAPISAPDLNGLDPLRISRILPAARVSNAALESHQAASAEVADQIQIDGLGNDFIAPLKRSSRLMIARAIFENADPATAAERLSPYAHLLTASNWTADWLKAATGREAKIIFEGIDPSLFCPGPRSGWLDRRKFYIFSGGKLEWRKAQDLTLLAFKRFAERHPDAVLVTAWRSPFVEGGRGFRGRLSRPATIGADGQIDIMRWVGENGVDPRQVIDLGLIPNVLLPGVLREMDVALQPSRAEACTSLPVKEAMACGVPVIAALNSGMTDILSDEISIPLRQQGESGPQGAAPAEGWGESDLDEIDAALERVYQGREAAAAMGLRARNWLIANRRTWADHAAELKAWLLSIDG